jgi:hypothetical protein
MNFIWGNVFEFFKERWRASIFFAGFAGVFGVMILGGLFYQAVVFYNLQPYWPYAATAAGLWILLCIWRAVRKARQRRLDRYKIKPLSRDEITKARSKLTAKQQFKRL